jgi:outer membrane immunogenic protein
MRKLLVGMSMFATAMFGGAAQAADMPVKAPPAPAPVYLWTGCYIGGNIGWANISTRFDDSILGDDGRRSKSGFAGGGQIGCDYQFASNWVFGVQGMFDGADLNSDHVGFINSDFTFHSDVRWFGTITARLGYLVTPQTLFYVKGGWGTVSQRFSVREIGVSGDIFSTDKNSSGGDVGVGFEWMFTPNWTFFVEWDHIFLNHTNITVVDFEIDDRVRRDFDKVLFGINWRFGGGRSSVY